MSKKTFYKETIENFKLRLNRYRDPGEAKEWLTKNKFLVQPLFKNISLRDFVFEPFKKVFQSHDDTEHQILSTITQVSIANAVLAGLPGKLGIGVIVAIALEAWMAFSVAKHVGIRIKDVNDIWKYFSLITATAVTILYIFKVLLNITFAILSMIPGLPLITVFTELIVTNIVGLLFWTGFEEMEKAGNFRVTKGALGRLISRLKKLLKFQKDFIRILADRKNIILVGKRLKSWLTGEVAITDPAIRGEIFSLAAMTMLISGRENQLDGPLGKIFLESIRRAYSVKLGDASIDEIASYFEDRTPEQRLGDVNLIKGEMFEHLIEDSENFDGDNVIAHLHDKRTVPGSDITFTNPESGIEIAFSIKIGNNPYLIEHALLKYPQFPIITNSEMEKYYGDNPMVYFSDYSDVELEKVTEENFDRLLNQLPEYDAIHVAGGGVSAKFAGQLWPFVIAYIRKIISEEQLRQAMTRVFGEAGKSLTSRVIWALALDTCFAWFLIARSILLITNPVMKSMSTSEKMASS